jgi:hypothetical protein
MLIKISLSIAVIIFGVLIVAQIQDPNLYVERQLEINGSAQTIFPYINNSEKSNEWMPWKESDPKVKINYSGPSEGVGSESHWTSDGPMGIGNSEVVESVENQLVKTKLKYTKPMEMQQMATLTLMPVSDGITNVKWSVEGEKTFFFKLMGLFFSCDNMIGKEFEKGLKKLKNIVEQPE